jgi:hypothetical protein
MLRGFVAGLTARLLRLSKEGERAWKQSSLNEPKWTIRTYSKKWMITSFRPGKMAINAAAPIIAHPAYRMAWPLRAFLFRALFRNTANLETLDLSA